MSETFTAIVNEFLKAKHKEIHRNKVKALLELHKKATIQVWRNDRIPDNLLDSLLEGRTFSRKIYEGQFADTKIYLKFSIKNPLLSFNSNQDYRMFLIIEKNQQCCVIQ